MPNLFNVDFVEFLELLASHKVDYLLVGGYAVILHGYVRSTGDLDLWINKTSDNYKKLKEVYNDFGAPIFSENEFLSNDYDVWSIGKEPNKIEILSEVKGLSFDESSSVCQWFSLENFKVPFIDFEDLIKAKLASGRFKDLADIEYLKELKKRKD
ncbi:MAG: DUF6036 family nucleotidyltransferase [Flavobacterium sp.]